MGRRLVARPIYRRAGARDEQRAGEGDCRSIFLNIHHSAAML
jgi:hypothetical protein